MAKLSIQDISCEGQRVIVRVDFNVPLENKQSHPTIADDTRIRAALPTLTHLLKQNAIIILVSHLGRPKGKIDTHQSLRSIGIRLNELLDHPVAFIHHDLMKPQDYEEVQSILAHAKPGQIFLLENIRFYPGEEKNDPDLGKRLAALGDIYINDAFGAAHRAHASTEAIARFSKKAVSGFLMQKELQFLSEAVEEPAKPFVVILGGAKVSDKINVIDRLIEKADTILIGGGMAYTFQYALGKGIGDSLCEPDKKEVALAAIKKAKQKQISFLLPEDNLIVDQLDFSKKSVGQSRFTQPGEAIPDSWQGVDIGPKTIKRYQQEIAKAKTILWNGPMGVFEIAACAQGTFAIAQVVAKNNQATSIVGGGDSIKAIKQAGVKDKITFISTGGGASLELLEGKTLPGVAALNDK
ncbi:MAG: phosphoglycerate kinase [Verrucomicrobiae bacterium]|nr:phosphoglycerate kinase [Verrucomicrobiae bacterium]